MGIKFFIKKTVLRLFVDEISIFSAITSEDQVWNPFGIFKRHNLWNEIVDIVSNLIVVAGVLTTVYFIYAGISYITAQGEQKKVDEAKKGITYSIIGLVVVFLSFAMTQAIKTIVNADPSPPSPGPPARPTEARFIYQKRSRDRIVVMNTSTGDYKTFRLDFGDGYVVTGNGPTPNPAKQYERTYNAIDGGNFSITLTIYDKDGNAINSKTETITIDPKLRIEKFESSKSRVEEDEMFTLSWTTKYAAKCESYSRPLVESWKDGEEKSINGSQEITLKQNLTGYYIFSIVCKNEGLDQSDSKDLTVWVVKNS